MSYTRRDFVRTLFVASQTALVGGLATDSLYAGAAQQSALNFAVIGDWGRRGRPDQSEVAHQMALACKNAGARFVIAVGDNFYEDGVADLQDPQWQQSYENVYNADSLPWYVILGNHDYHGNWQAQLDYAKTHPRWVMPARYFSQVYPIDIATNVECFFIDTSPMIAEYQNQPIMRSIHTQNVGAQLQWLDEAIGRSTAQWKIVVGHHPIYSAGGGHGDQQDMINFILPILQKHKIPAYFSGHDHDLQHLTAGDIQLFVSGGGSEHRFVLGSPHAQFAKSASGFAMVSLQPHEMQVRFIDNKGMMLHEAVVKRVA